jgi:hypothetical protein
MEEGQVSLNPIPSPPGGLVGEEIRTTGGSGSMGVLLIDNRYLTALGWVATTGGSRLFCPLDVETICTLYTRFSDPGHEEC